MNLPKLSNDFLNNLYIKSQNDFLNGFSEVSIRQLSGIDYQQAENIQNYLKSKNYIQLGKHKNDFNIYITPDGIDSITKLKENKIFNTIKFTGVQYVHPGSRAVIQFMYYYNLVDENHNISSKRIFVIISDQLSINWGFRFWSQRPELDYPNLIKILLQYTKDYIIEKLKEGTLNDYEELVLFTTTHPEMHPYNPDNLIDTENAEFEVEIGQKTIGQEIKENKLAASIIEHRDIINAIFYKAQKSKLLLLNEERNLLDFFKTAISEEEFSHRISSLGEVARNLNVEILRKLTGISDKEIRSVQLLKSFFEQNNVNGDKIIEILKNIGRARQGYPIHSDITGVIEGLAYFKINYPINNYEEAWLILLNEYLSALRQLYTILSDFYFKKEN